MEKKGMEMNIWSAYIVLIKHYEQQFRKIVEIIFKIRFQYNLLLQYFAKVFEQLQGVIYKCRSLHLYCLLS